MTVEGAARWETYLRTQFPAYLLPRSASERLSEAEASRFLAALTGKPTAFAILRSASFVAPRMTDLLAFVSRVKELVRALPSTTETTHPHWKGGFQGKLDLRATAMLHQQGRRTEFVTRTPRRDFDLAENVVLRSVCERLVALLADLRIAKVMPDKGWSLGGRECEGALRHLLGTTALRNVSHRTVHAPDLASARSARDPVFHEAARWHDDLCAGLDSDDPRQIARTVAEGALLPLDAASRFEIAVAMKLIATVSEALASAGPQEWTHERGLIVAGRSDLATLRRGALAIRFFYNQAVLDPGPTDLGVQHYFATRSRMRPDVTVVLERGETLISALVVECKNTVDASYLATGFREAMLYRHEYASVLRGSVKALLVTGAPVSGMPRQDHDVIAVTWDAWPPAEVVASVLSWVSGLSVDGPARRAL